MKKNIILMLGIIMLSMSACRKDEPIPHPRPVPPVQPVPVVPTLDKVGIYDKEGNPLLSYKMVARLKGGLWLCESGADPYKKRLFLPKVREGEKKIVIKAEGFPSVLEINSPPEGRSLSVVVERTTAEYIQVRSGNFRFVLERQKGTSAST